jgi:hypothetical protein
MRTLPALLLAGLLAAAPASAESSARGAFFRSLLLPGWGQHAAGRTGAAGCFLGAEVGLWAAYLGADRLAAVRADNFRDYAAEHAGAQTSGKSGVFFDDLGFYASVQQHNLYAAYEDGPQAALYSLTPEFLWEWESDAARREYRDLRNGSRSADRAALYVAGLVAVNHLLAAVHAARTASSTEGEAAETALTGPGVTAAYEPARGLARLSVVRRF